MGRLLGLRRVHLEGQLVKAVVLHQRQIALKWEILLRNWLIIMHLHELLLLVSGPGGLELGGLLEGQVLLLEGLQGRVLAVELGLVGVRMIVLLVS